MAVLHARLPAAADPRTRVGTPASRPLHRASMRGFLWWPGLVLLLAYAPPFTHVQTR